jgi:hypothetical protein
MKIRITYFTNDNDTKLKSQDSKNNVESYKWKQKD